MADNAMSKARLHQSASGSAGEHVGTVLLAVSGLDGSGKSTLVRKVVDDLSAVGKSAAAIKVPDLYTWSLLEELGRDDEPYAPYAFDADRISLALNLERFSRLRDLLTSQPAETDFLVIDRFLLDWAAVGRAFGSGEHELVLLRGIARLMKLPVLSFFIEVSPAVADKRITDRGRTGDPREGLHYLTRAYECYWTMIESPQFDPHILDGELPPKDLSAAVLSHLRDRGFLAGDATSKASSPVRDVGVEVG
ncbi:dTMP kinase [Nocardia asiatica]|uniref:dTMP kinase n=1 Tax=Nocardia asiatica TaxID=209252 RepID=UPI0024541910|nr:AAA family ATPase [Nocardia asiatica]